MVAKVLLVVGVVLGGAALYAGFDYYLIPLPERPFSPLHTLYAPSGLVGQGFGVVGTAMIVSGVGSYSIRKRVGFLERLGKLRTWLQVHIFLCLFGPFLIVLHTSFKIGGLVSIAFWSMALVVGSGVFGRWVYVWIPKTANGRFLGREEIRARLHEVLRDLEGRLRATPEEVLALIHPDRQRGLDPTRGMFTGGEPDSEASGANRRRRSRERRGLVGAAWDTLRYQIGRRRARAKWHQRLEAAGVRGPERSRIVASLEEERNIEQQLRMLEPFQSAFRYWHAFHLPLATVMLLILVVHVGVALAFGYTWIWAN
jgi:hypothetical protein